MKKFARARHGGVTKWSSRLEDIVGKTIDKGMMQHKDAISYATFHAMIRTINITSRYIWHEYDSFKDFDELFEALVYIDRGQVETKI